MESLQVRGRGMDGSSEVWCFFVFLCSWLMLDWGSGVCGIGCFFV